MIDEFGRMKAKVRDRKVLITPAIPNHTHADRSRARMAKSPFYPTLTGIR